MITRKHYESGNYDRFTNNSEFMASVANAISQFIRRPLTINEKAAVVSRLRYIDPTILAGHSRQKILKTLVKTMIDELFKPHEVIDLRQKMIDEIGVSSESDVIGNPGQSYQAPEKHEAVHVVKAFGIDDYDKLARLLNPSSYVRRNYIVLDSRHRLYEGDGTKYFRWDHGNDSRLGEGIVNTEGKVRDVIGFRVHPFRIPNVATASNVMKRITMLISEFAHQAAIGPESRRYHFIMKVEPDGGFLNLEPGGFDDGYVYFRNPISGMNNFTVTFGNPFQPILFEHDRDKATFTYGATTTLTFTRNHGLADGDKIYLTDFTSDAATADASVIASMNSKYGLGISNLTNTTFTVAVDTSSITPTAGLAIYAFFEPRRIIIPLTILYIQPSRD